ncbi:MAG: hypothetical protein Q7K54_03570, partial [Candidatus Parcubacteria bacterium]|nr:hypothetical protein [Candidatus Parcubacteria bacterium]
SFPVVELGSCTDKASCKAYCDKTENIDACLSFAKKNNLMSSEELTNAKKFKDNGMTGPGGCKGKDKCDTYCSDSANIDECITFAEKNGLMSDLELSEAKKVQAAIVKGIKPPACGGKKSCETYCSSSEHMEECMNFSIEAGIMDPQKQEESKKFLAAIKQGIKPPACKGKDACDEYCGTHQEECMSFSLAAGMVPDDQKEQMQKTLTAFKQGIKPPACRPNPPDQSRQPSQPNRPDQSEQGLQACDQYCADSSHVEECVKFSVAIGNMTQEQGQNSIKNGNKGPGGCVGKDACSTFCDNPDNQDTCFNFAKDNGMISEEDLQNMQDGQPGQGGSRKPGKNQNNQGQINEQIQPWKDMCSNNTELACADDAGGFITDAKIGEDKQPVCPTGSTAKCGNFQQQNQQNVQQNQQGQNQPRDKFQPGSGSENPGGQRMPQQAGPGGCKGPEECQKYCISNPEVCKNFQPQQNQQGQPNQPDQKMQPSQRMPQQQPGQPNQGGTSGLGACGTGPGTCSGIGPDDINQQNQPGQMQPQQQIQPQIQQQEGLPPPPVSFLLGVQNFLANVLNASR